jgi:hypothetical protein
MTTMIHDDRDIRHRAIRTALRISFPSTKFSVRGSRGTGYGWSTVEWIDGPSEDAVSSLVCGFFGSSFDGMTDGYDPTGCCYTFEGVTYRAGGSGYHVTRRISPSFARRLLAQVADYFGVPVDQRPVVVEKLDWRNRLDWSLRWLDGRDVSIMDHIGQTTLEWRTAMHRAVSDRTAYARQEAA